MQNKDKLFIPITIFCTIRRTQFSEQIPEQIFMYSPLIQKE